MQFIDLQAQYQHLKEKIDIRIQKVLDHGKYIMGPEVSEFEEKLADYVGVKHAITCANGTDALQLSLMAMEIGPGDAVFCPTFTFFASAEAIAFVGASPIFVDSDEATYNICPVDLEKRIISARSEGQYNLKAIMGVDLFGLPANYPEIQKLADKYGLLVIEDAAQGFGGSINGNKAGSFGDIATTSFFPAKPLGCYGDGGAIFTDNDDYADLIKSLRIHGKGLDKYDNVRIGMNSRLDTVQAAILIEKLNEFPLELDVRQKIATTYTEALDKHFITPKVPKEYISAWAQYTIRPKRKNRETLMKALNQHDIPSMIYYKKNMHEQEAFSKITVDKKDFKIADLHARNVFSIPLHPYLEQKEQAFIVKNLNFINSL